MIELESLSCPEGANRDRKRVGRGPGSGRGKTSGRGHKGQKARSGGNLKPWFEGGQMPLQRRVPKRGFRPWRPVEYQIVNVRDLQRVEGKEVTPETLKSAGLIGSLRRPVKILGDGEVESAFTVSAHAFSATAREKIEKAGGTVSEID